MCVVIDHPLQPFSRSDFRQDIEPCSHPAELCEAGRMADRSSSWPALRVASGLPEPGELRTLHACDGKPYLMVVEPMGVLPHRQQELMNPWGLDGFGPTSYIRRSSVEPVMQEGFYAVCEPQLTRRRFLKFTMLAGLAPAFRSEVYAAHDTDQGVRQFIEQYAVTSDDPWAIVHAIRAVGGGCRIDGENAAAYVLRTCVRAQEVNNQRYLYIPANIEVHTNMFLKTFLEAGVPASETFACDGRVYHLQDLGEGAKALFRFDPGTFDRNNLAWSLIAFAELEAHEWENAYRERVQLQEVVRFGLRVLEEATQGLKPYAAAGLPLPKKMPIHDFTCGGTHLCYSLLVAAKHGLLQAAGGDILQEQLQMLVYRLQADPDLIDRYYRAIPAAPGVDLFRAGAKLKILGHALECLGYAQVHGLWQPGPSVRRQIEQAVQAVRGLFSYVVTLDLAAIRRRQAQLGQQLVGDTCHAVRGLSLV
jgi:hypothetical protein